MPVAVVHARVCPMHRLCNAKVTVMYCCCSKEQQDLAAERSGLKQERAALDSMRSEFESELQQARSEMQRAQDALQGGDAICPEHCRAAKTLPGPAKSSTSGAYTECVPHDLSWAGRDLLLVHAHEHITWMGISV